MHKRQWSYNYIHRNLGSVSIYKTNLFFKKYYCQCWWVWHLCISQRSHGVFQTKTILRETEQHSHWMIGACTGHRPRFECLGQWVFNCSYKVLQFQAGVPREPVWMQQFREDFFTTFLRASKCKPLTSLGLSSLISQEGWENLGFSSV